MKQHREGSINSSGDSPGHYGPMTLKDSMWYRLKDIQQRYCNVKAENPKKKQ